MGASASAGVLIVNKRNNIKMDIHASGAKLSPASTEHVSLYLEYVRKLDLKFFFRKGDFDVKDLVFGGNLYGSAKKI